MRAGTSRSSLPETVNCARESGLSQLCCRHCYALLGCIVVGQHRLVSSRPCYYFSERVGEPLSAYDLYDTGPTGSNKICRSDKIMSLYYYLYCSPNIVRVIKSRRMRRARHVACMGGGRGVYKVLVGKPEGKRPLGRPRRRWEDNIKMDLREVGRGCGDWMELAQDRDRWREVVSTVMNFRVP